MTTKIKQPKTGMLRTCSSALVVVSLAAAVGCGEGNLNKVQTKINFPDGPVASEHFIAEGLSGVIRFSDYVLKDGRNYSLRTDFEVDVKTEHFELLSDDPRAADKFTSLSEDQAKFLRIEIEKVKTAFDAYTNSFTYKFGYSEAGPAVYPSHKR